MTNNLDDDLDFLDEVAAPPPKRGRRRREDEFSTGLEDVSYSEAAQATASISMAGQYKRYTVYLSPESIARFKEVAADVELSQAETARWFFQHMFELYDRGVRPATEPVVVKRRLKRGRQ
jgi:hypothetical protein